MLKDDARWPEEVQAFINLFTGSEESFKKSLFANDWYKRWIAFEVNNQYQQVGTLLHKMEHGVSNPKKGKTFMETESWNQRSPPASK